jgi:tetratricopeptide (TPR) repeat protein
LVFYLKQWLLPLRLSEFYDLPLRDRWDLLHVAAPLAVLAALAAALWYFRRHLGERELAFALVAVAAPLLPALNLSLFARGELVLDRYAYLPGLGAALIVALAVHPFFRGRPVFRMPQGMLLVTLALLLPLSYSTANASSYWVNDFVLFEHAHRMAPENATARNNYAVQIARHGDPGTALAILEKLAKERPDYYLASYNLGRLLYEVNLVPAAEHYLQQAKKIDPQMPDAYMQLGMIYMRTGRTAEAESHFRSAVALRPRDPKLRFALGVVLARPGNCDAARAEFARALALQPGFPRAQEQSDQCDREASPEEPRTASAKSAEPSSGRAPLLPAKQDRE